MERVERIQSVLNKIWTLQSTPNLPISDRKKRNIYAAGALGAAIGGAAGVVTTRFLPSDTPISELSAAVEEKEKILGYCI